MEHAFVPLLAEVVARVLPIVIMLEPRTAPHVLLVLATVTLLTPE
jgi:hypothetical protein